MDTIELFLSYDNKTKLVIIASIFLFYSLVSSYGLSIHTFILLLLCFTLLSYKNVSTKQKKQLKQGIELYIEELEKDVQNHRTPEMVLEHVYVIHKPLKDLYHIKKNNVFKDVMYKLRFLQIYEKQQYFDIVVMAEYFLKIHFNMMIGKYDYQTYFVIMQDIRQEMINSLYSCYFNIPKYSKTFDSQNLERDLKWCIHQLQSITFKLTKIIRNKYQLSDDINTYDLYKNSRYHIM